MVIPEVLRERVLNNLRRQRTVTDDALLSELVDAVIDGRLNGRDDVKQFITMRGNVVNAKWVQTQCKHLHEIWSFINPDLSAETDTPCTELVPIATSPSTLSLAIPSSAATVDTSPPPPPLSMIYMRDALRNYWYKQVEIPLVAPPVTHGVDDDIPFDRNDLYYTNEKELKKLLEYGALPREQLELSQSLMFVRLMTGEGRNLRQYITWCKRGEFHTFSSQVNNRDVRCNDYVTSAINKGLLFRVESVCDELGWMRIGDLDDFLYIMEGYIDGFGTRHPLGFNYSEVPHMVHRSLHQMGGNRAALQSYAKWQDAVQRTQARVGKVNALVEEAKKALKACQEWEEKNTDIDLAEVFCVKWETKCNESVAELMRAEKEFTNAWKARRQLNDNIVGALADTYINLPYIKPTKLLELREMLQLPEPDHVHNARVAVNELQRTLETRPMSVRAALIELELWNGKARMPFFCRKMVNQAFKRISLRIHPDRNNDPSEQGLLEPFKQARTCLHNYLKMRGVPDSEDVEQ